jgi:hypothetical protein
MIKQILTHYEKTYIVKSFKEYINKKLILCEKYNPYGNITYRYRRNIEQKQEWQKWIYDENNNNTYYETSKGMVWNVLYNHDNQISLEVSNMGKYKEFKYDELNRLISVEKGNTLSEILPIISQYTYDENGERNKTFTISNP